MSGSDGAADPTTRFGRFEILLAERRLHVDGSPVPLGSRAFDLLAALVTRRDRIVPKDELIDVVWPGLVVEDNNLQVQVSALRKVLGTTAIATVPGRGYQFTVAPAPNLASAAPSIAPAPAPVGAMRPASATSPARSRLLVADDNKVNRLLLCRSLELMGHDVTTVENGRRALEHLRSGPFDLLLLDLEMPELDGFGVLEQRGVDAALREVPVIVTSSLEGVAAIARCIELGADDYLHKPVNPLLLKARVESSLERKHLRDRQRELLARLAPDVVADGSEAASEHARATEGRLVTATLLAARVGAIDALLAAQPAPETLALLSDWMTLMLDVVEGRGGRTVQMSGDGLVAVFDAADPASGDDPPWAAARAALEMHELTAQLNAERSTSGQAAIALAIGLASGEVISGRAGTTRRATAVCIGSPARRAAQLTEGPLASPASGSTCIDAATHVALRGRVAAEALPPRLLAGAAKAVAAYRLTTRST